MTYLKLNDFQKNYMTEIRKLAPGQPFKPWKKEKISRTPGVFACGWTKNNEILMINYDGYNVIDPHSKVEKTKQFIGGSYDQMTFDNLEFILPDTKERVKIFGLYGGDGNHVTSDGWKLEIIYPAWPNSIALIRKPKEPGVGLPNRWQGIKLISLEILEYINLKAGFSPNEKFFLIMGSQGVEIFKREEF